MDTPANPHYLPLLGDLLDLHIVHNLPRGRRRGGRRHRRCRTQELRPVDDKVGRDAVNGGRTTVRRLDDGRFRPHRRRPRGRQPGQARRLDRVLLLLNHTGGHCDLDNLATGFAATVDLLQLVGGDGEDLMLLLLLLSDLLKRYGCGLEIGLLDGYGLLLDLDGLVLLL